MMLIRRVVKPQTLKYLRPQSIGTRWRWFSTASSATGGDMYRTGDMETSPFHRGALPKFDQFTAEDFERAVDSEYANILAKLDELSGGNIVLASPSDYKQLQLAKDEFERTVRIIRHLNGVANTEQVREINERVQKKETQVESAWAQNPYLYEYHQNISSEGPASSGLTLDKKAQFRSSKIACREAELTGISLPADKRSKYARLMEEESALGSKFSNNIIDSIKGWKLVLKDHNSVSAIPSLIKQQMAENYQTKVSTSDTITPDGEKGPWLLTLDPTVIVPVLQYCDDRETRRQLYFGHISKASELGEGGDNREIIDKILAIRQEQADMLGYNNFAELRLTRNMARTPENVLEFLDNLRSECYEKAKEEIAEVQNFAASHGFEQDLQPWDVPYWSEKLKESRYGINAEELRDYFPLPRVLNGLFKVIEQVFQVEVSELATQKDGAPKTLLTSPDSKQPVVPVWDENVYFFLLKDKVSQTPIGGFYLDPYARPESKSGGAWMDECCERSSNISAEESQEPFILDGIRLPVAYVVCNQSAGSPSLMRFEDVLTLFHEMGHCLQHTLTRVNNVDVSGIKGIDLDAIEFPSQFMENWCIEDDRLKDLSSHKETGEPLPAEMREKIRRSRKFMSGSFLLRQLRISRTDMELHLQGIKDRTDSRNQCGFDFLGLQKDIAKSHSIVHPPEEDRFLCSFFHIFQAGYAAGYYSYLWAQVMAQDAYAAFEEQEKHTVNLGSRFRETVLSYGGAVDPMDVFKEFRGREPSSKYLLDLYVRDEKSQ